MGYRSAEVIRDGLRVVILGAPNAGKSSLLNALAKRDAAIVSDEAGTTRDLVEVTLDLDGYKVVVTDTAGLRDGAGKVEALGIARAREAAARSDLVVCLYDLGAASGERIDAGPVSHLHVGSKADIAPSGTAHGVDHVISARSGAGIAELLKILRAEAETLSGRATGVIPSRRRHVTLLGDAAGHLEAALAGRNALELRAEELRLAADALGRICGAVGVEDLLGAIFSEFCIGK